MNQKAYHNDPMRDQIYLAALLHDIGKFYQRADTGAVKSSLFLKDEVKKLESMICPQYKGYQVINMYCGQLNLFSILRKYLKIWLVKQI